jgi:hypothetical protein
MAIIEHADAPDPPGLAPGAAEPGDPEAAMRALGALAAEEAAGREDGAHSETLPAIGEELGLSPLEVLPQWTGRLLLVLGVLTLPWIAFLASELPNRARVAHEDVTWAGFDVLLSLLLLRTGWSALRKREHIELTAGMTGALLIVDAWFDLTSAATPAQFGAALAMALCVELPLAGFCLWIAGRVEFARRKRSERLAALVRRLDRRRRAGARSTARTQGAE